ncbi:hypothetical protein [Sulfitobacter sp.]|uniref:hypothetical protein n=1 Tax=Sulfitobacter sp. TaxID=1903071 RepID=UPI003296BC79
MTDKSNIAFVKQALPEHWYDQSMELRDAAEFLWRQKGIEQVGFVLPDEVYSKPRYSRTVFLLIGFAIENMIKGILISEVPARISGGKMAPDISTGHDLCAWAKLMASITISEREENILNLLSELVPYWGKYPSAKKKHHVREEKHLTPQVFNEILDLHNRLELGLYDLNRDGLQEVDGVKFPIMVLPHLH